MQNCRLFRFTVMMAAAACAGKICAAAPVLPAGIKITSDSATHVHADISALRLEDFPALAQVHALHTVYFHGAEATDEKVQALAQLHFTNLVGVVFTDCSLITDQGIEPLSQIPTLHSLGLRRMAVTDAVCETMVKRMRLRTVTMPNCTNVTVDGLSKLAKSDTMESLGFSVGQMSQADLIRIINTGGPKVNRMEMEMTESAEGRLDLPGLRQVAAVKQIKLYAVRNKRAKKL